jgi:hypothetical protein
MARKPRKAEDSMRQNRGSSAEVEARAQDPSARTEFAWRPPKTTAQKGSVHIDWNRTYHVDSVVAFINGLFGLYSGVFQNFLDDAGQSAKLGETILYQVKDPTHLRFEIKKIGPNEYEVRGAHFATPSGVNICVGMHPQQQGGTLT